MRAFTQDSFDTPAGLREDLPAPEAGPGRLLVRVRASSVNPVDGFIAAGHVRGMAEHEFPGRPGPRLRRGGRAGDRGRHRLRRRRGPGPHQRQGVATAATMDRLAGLLADGTLRVPIQAGYPLAQAGQAIETLTGQHPQGKVALSLP